MNPFTLKFLDDKLEKKYQENYSNELYDAFKYTMVLLTFSNLILSTFWIQMGQLIIGILMIIICAFQTATFYYVLFRKQYITIVGYLIAILSLLSSFYQFMPYFYTEFADKQFIWVFDISQFMALNFALSPNFLLNQFLQISFVTSRLFLRNYNGINIYSFILILYLILFWQKEYFRQKHNRNQFFLKEEKKQASFLLDEIINEKIIILSYDKRWEKIEINYINNSMKNTFQFEQKEALKDFKLLNSKIDLYDYIFKQISNGDINTTIQTIYIPKRQRYFVQVITNNLVEFSIYLKFTEYETTSSQQNNQLYLKLLKKIKQFDKTLYYQEIQKNIIAEAYYLKKKTIEKIETLTFKKLQNYILFIMKKQIKLYFYICEFQTILPLFFTLLTCLTKLYDIKEIKLVQKNENEVEFEIQGKAQQLNTMRFQTCVKIINNLITQIGLNELNVNLTTFQCTLLNLNYKIDNINKYYFREQIFTQQC